MPITAPVPPGYAKQFDSQTTSTYGMHQVATGPYMIKNDSSGNINGVGYRPGTLIELVRNPNWNAKTSWRPAYADQILFKEGFQDPTVQTKMILGGTADVNGDTPPPAAELKSILANPSQKPELVFTPTGGSRYVALNTAKAPFDNADVRKAVAYVLDKNAMRLTRGGAIDGSIASHFIDPSFGRKGFAQSGGFEFNPFGTSANAGNVPMAKEMLKKAGYSSGMYTGRRSPRSPTTRLPDRTPRSSSRPTWPRSASRSRRSRSPTRPCTRSSATCRSRSRTSARTSAGSPTSTSRRRSSTRRSTGRTSSRSTTRTGRSSTTRHQQADRDGGDDRRPDPPLRRLGRIDDEVAKTAAAVPWLWENFPSALLDARDARVRGLERRRPGRHLHGGQVTPTWPRLRTPSHPRPPGAMRREGLGACSPRPGRRLVIDGALHLPSHPLGRLPAAGRQRAHVPDLRHVPLSRPGGAAGGRSATPELIAQIRHQLGLDRPLYDQYWIYLKGLVLHFDLGYSYQNDVSVRSQIFARLPATISLPAGALVVWLLVGSRSA